MLPLTLGLYILRRVLRIHTPNDPVHGFEYQRQPPADAEDVEPGFGESFDALGAQSIKSGQSAKQHQQAGDHRDEAEYPGRVPTAQLEEERVDLAIAQRAKAPDEDDCAGEYRCQGQVGHCHSIFAPGTIQEIPGSAYNYNRSSTSAGQRRPLLASGLVSPALIHSVRMVQVPLEVACSKNQH